MRHQDYKIISLKQIVQQALIATGIATSADSQLRLRGELSLRNVAFADPVSRYTARPHASRVLVNHITRQNHAHRACSTAPKPRILHMHSECDLSSELKHLVPGLLPGVAFAVLPRRESGVAATWSSCSDLVVASLIQDSRFSSRLVVPVYDGCFQDEQLVTALQLALEAKIPVVLVHERDPEHGGCEFGVIFDACPRALKKIRGHKDQAIFDPIAVAWVRGPHIAVSSRLLALALGAGLGGTQSAALYWERARERLSNLVVGRHIASGACCGSVPEEPAEPVGGSRPAAAEPADSKAGSSSVSADRRVRGWSVFDSPGDTQSGGSAAGEPTNPIWTNPMTRGGKPSSPDAGEAAV